MVGEGDPLGQPPMSPQAGGIPQHLSDHAQSMEDHRMGSYASPYQRYIHHPVTNNYLAVKLFHKQAFDMSNDECIVTSKVNKLLSTHCINLH